MCGGNTPLHILWCAWKDTGQKVVLTLYWQISIQQSTNTCIDIKGYSQKIKSVVCIETKVESDITHVESLRQAIIECHRVHRYVPTHTICGREQSYANCVVSVTAWCACL